MDSHTQTVIVLGVVALCAIVGIYYCVVRKLRKSAQLQPSPKDLSSQ
jgi:hypothetical protein